MVQHFIAVEHNNLYNIYMYIYIYILQWTVLLVKQFLLKQEIPRGQLHGMYLCLQFEKESSIMFVEKHTIM